MAATLESILIVGSKRKGAIENAYAKAFDRLGVSLIDHFDLEQPSKLLSQNRIINRLTQHVQYEFTGRNFFQYLRLNAQKYDAVIVFKGMQLTPAWLAKCKLASQSATWVNFNPDDPFNLISRGATNQNVFKSIGLYDIYVTWAKHLIPSIKKKGCPVAVYLPFAFDEDYHFPSNSLSMDLSETITFVGTWDKQREQVLTEIADMPLMIFGSYWDRISKRSPLRGKIHPANLYGEELRRVISSSKASLNILRPQNSNAHNMRTFEIPAMRGLMVTTSSEEQNYYFPEGQACLMYKDSQELRSKLKKLLNNVFDIKSMKEEAFSLRIGHSYKERAYALCEIILWYRQDELGARK